MPAMADSLDYFLANVLSQDTKKRIETGEDLVNHLRNKGSSVRCEDIDKFVDGLTSWINSSSFKVSLLGLDVVSCLIDRMSGGFKTHVTTVLPAVIDRLGDSKDQVRENAREVLIKLMSPASSPQYVMDRMTPAFTHKLWKVKDEALICLQRAVNEFGTKSLTLSKVVPLVVKLLDDPSVPVREQTVSTLLEIYRHVGERLRIDLSKKDINPTKLNNLFVKMDELRNCGLVLAADDCTDHDAEGVQSAASSKIAKRSVSSTRTLPKSSKPASAQAAGALDEDAFMMCFETVPKVYVSSARDVNDRMTRIRETLMDTGLDWEKRVDMLKELRSLVIAGATEYGEFQALLRSLEPCLKLSVLDLRSQVVREACISISFLAQLLGKEFDHVAEAILPSLIQLIPNSAKIMASSGCTTIRFILQHVHSPRLIPLITTNLSSKAPIIRRQCCEYVEQIIHTWSTSALERQLTALNDSIKKGLGDADPEARVNSRRAFWGFDEHFKEQAAAMLNSLDASQQKQLLNAKPLSSSSSSTNSLNMGATAKRHTQPIVGVSAAAAEKMRPRSFSTDRASTLGQSRIAMSSSQTMRAPAPKASRVARDPAADCYSQTDDGLSYTKTLAGAAHRVKSSPADSAAYKLRLSQSTTDLSANVSPPKAPSALPIVRNNSLRVRSGGGPASSGAVAIRQKKSSIGARPSDYIDASNLMSAEKQNRGKNGMSRSQPGSRSGSPSSRSDPMPAVPGLSSRVAYNQGSARDASPSRILGGRDKRSIGGSLQPAGRVLASKSVSHHEEKVETVTSDALSERAGSDTTDNDSELIASEISSLCSEGSYAHSSTSDDIGDIIVNLTSGLWSDRRDGLFALQRVLKSKRKLSGSEIRKLSDIFSRMFHDPHIKVFSPFLDTLADFMCLYGADLTEWLSICLPRLFTKMGVEVLGSVQTKMHQAIEAMRDSFPYMLQFNLTSKFIVDQTQSVNTKVKTAVLSYMHSLTLLMDPSDLVNNSDTRLALTRVITWTSEPKCVDVRKVAQAVLISMFSLNTPVFTDMLRSAPKTFQDSAGRILQNQMHCAEPLAPHNFATPASVDRVRDHASSSILAHDHPDAENFNPSDSMSRTLSDSQFESSQLISPRSSTKDLHGFYDPQNYPDKVGAGSFQFLLIDRSHLHKIMSAFQKMSNVQCDAGNDIFNEKFPAASAMSAVEVIIAELSNRDCRNDERQQAMRQLISLIRGRQADTWSEHFKTILLLILETLADSNDQVCAMSLRVLREIAKRQPNKFSSYAELTILKLLEAQKDSTKEVNRAAEDCATAVAQAIPAEQCINILNPFVDTSEFPVNLAAVKMQTRVIEAITDKNVARQLVPELVPRLLKGYDNAESSVRKASVFCLVELYLLVGEELRSYLSSLTSSKSKLLNLYIKRALAQKSDGSSTDASSSPATVIENF